MISLGLAIGAIILGAILKGAIGAGVPVIAAPAITILYDVQTAVAVLVLPNVISNLWQAWQYRRQSLGPRFLAWFAGAGMAGVLLGTWMLTALPQHVLSLFVAAAVIAYIALRLSRPNWVLSRAAGMRFSGLAGLAGGLLQGAAGVSAPASLSYLNAMRLPREVFIGTISAFFIAISVVQIPALVGVGLLTPTTAGLGLATSALVAVVMPAGAWLGRKFSARTFDLVLLGVLGIIAARIIWQNLI